MRVRTEYGRLSWLEEVVMGWLHECLLSGGGECVVSGGGCVCVCVVCGGGGWQWLVWFVVADCGGVVCGDE